ncbi:MAG: helix-turn-helix transcriptional regulator [Bosea sp.]|uniref:helix-turn-helix transcriptional regulator n=1 Tax=Bosea sp. (in: a-proteobacteria) TaxID=1871050 RepID=UPI002382FF06|nr:helix-turn-helix transcriptional regulator [Bosea sp. (in: a-proteobacteria)]MCP4734381.1 helix-turn-helix transcriptional regulator [Bosea sp. (in: a-proteobacteria)]
MARANLDVVTDAVDGLLDAALDFRQMSGAIEQVRHLFDGSKICLGYFGPNSHPDDAITNASDPDLNAFLYRELMPDAARFAARVAAVPIGSAYRDQILFGEDFRDSRLWREWMAPQDMYGGMASRVLDVDGSFWMFDIQRGRRQEMFDASEFALFERVAGVMRRVTLLHHQLGGISIEREMARRALDELSLAVIVVDRAMQFAYANAAGDELLANAAGPLGLQGGRLWARAASEQSGLKELVAKAGDLAGARGQMLLRARSGEGRDVSLCVTPLSAAYTLPGRMNDVMIVARPLEPAGGGLAAVRQMFDLTEAEARLALGLASGLSLTEVAQQQGIRLTTARTHLARVFWKTGTRQQSQVAALLRAAELPVRTR